ncbi:hypothetical protein POG22_10950 [Geitlerinema sp. CS-897]|nr:hypothetical protein [Geitlerinema sp. CS-897]
MFDRQSQSKNRLLALERELLGRGRSSQYSPVPKRPVPEPYSSETQNIVEDKIVEDNSDRLAAPRSPDRSSPKQNRLLELENSLQTRERTSQRPTRRPTKPDRAQRSPSHPPPTPRIQFESYIFDTGEPIIVGDRHVRAPSPFVDRRIDRLGDVATRPESVPERIMTGDRPLDSQVENVKLTENGHRSRVSNDEITEVQNDENDIDPSNNSANNGLHEAFGDIREEMSYATAFDLGTVEVEIPFDEFDKAIDDEHSDRERAIAQSHSLDPRFDEFDEAIALGKPSSDRRRSPPPVTAPNALASVKREPRYALTPFSSQTLPASLATSDPPSDDLATVAFGFSGDRTFDLTAFETIARVARRVANASLPLIVSFFIYTFGFLVVFAQLLGLGLAFLAASASQRDRDFSGFNDIPSDREMRAIEASLDSG